MKHLKTFATGVAIFGIIMVMLAAMAFQISSEQIASESTAAQAPAGQLGLGESAFASGDYPAAIQYADHALTLLGNETSPTQDLLRYNALVLKGQAQLAKGEVLAARNTLALACAYKSTWPPAYYYRGVAYLCSVSMSRPNRILNMPWPTACKRTYASRRGPTSTP